MKIINLNDKGPMTFISIVNALEENGFVCSSHKSLKDKRIFVKDNIIITVERTNGID